MSNGRKYENPCIYQVKVKGALQRDWSGWFEGFDISPQKEDESMITVRVEDQAALQGLLAKITNLGLPLLSVNRLEIPEEVNGSPIEGKGELKNEHSH